MPRSATEGAAFSPPEDRQRLGGDGAGPRLWSAALLSALGSAVAVAAVGCVCALLYPILKGRPPNWASEVRPKIRFWSVLVLSLLTGCVCCVFSLTLTYLDSEQPGARSQTLTPAQHRDASVPGFHMRYGVAVLNGIMGLLAAIWSLT
uniref:ADP-ribosylation factor-like 6 interacting protein 6 n=1 Tax=Mola mola TaxID=94237 RepID=A0A3Q3W2C5_MOLML